MGQTRAWLAGVWVSCVIAAAPPEPRFLSFAEAREIMTAFNRTEDASAWDIWVRTQDRDVRARIERGVEDSISNLILYGTSFTGLPRLESPEASVTSAGELGEVARARVRAPVAALARTQPNERLRFAREYLARQGVEPKDMEAFLAANLTRFAMEQRGYQEKLRLANEHGDAQEMLFVRATLFDRRGLSVDTSLLPNYALEDTLRAMLRKSAPGASGISRWSVQGWILRTSATATISIPYRPFSRSR